MGVAHNWYASFITDEQHAIIHPHFEHALTKAIPSQEETEAMNYWREKPERLGKAYPLEIDGYHKVKQINTFSSGFHLMGLVELAQSFCFGDSPFEGYMNEESNFNFIMTNRNTPTAILWYSLGYEIAKQLPGLKGNLLVHSSEVAKRLKEVRTVYDQMDGMNALKMADNFAGVDVEEATLRNIIYMIPEALTAAFKRKTGIMLLSIPSF